MFFWHLLIKSKYRVQSGLTDPLEEWIPIIRSFTRLLLDYFWVQSHPAHFTTSNRFLIRAFIVIYEALCFDVAQGRMNGAPNKTRTHSCRFASQPCKPLHYPRCPNSCIYSFFEQQDIISSTKKSDLIHRNRSPIVHICKCEVSLFGLKRKKKL